MTSPDWEAANEDDADRWARFEAHTGLTPPQRYSGSSKVPATWHPGATPASDRVVWRDRGARIAALEAENDRLLDLLANESFEHDGTYDEMSRRAESAEAEVERLREVEAGIRALHFKVGIVEDGKPVDWCKADGREWPCPTVALLAPSPAATTGEADDLANLTAKFEALKPQVEAEIERRKNTPTCPTCGSDGEPYEAKDGSTCTNPFHAAPVSSGEAATGEAVGGPCPLDAGSRPFWMSEWQYDPCKCLLTKGHEQPCVCSHTAPAPVVTPSDEGDASNV